MRRLFLTTLTLLLLNACTGIEINVESVPPTVSTPEPTVVPITELTNTPTPGQAIVEVAFCTNVTEIPQIECEALVTIYNQLDGVNWSSQNGWIQTHTPCSWERVSCLDQHVTELDFYDTRLRGAVPAEIGRLTKLEHLNMEVNNLSSLPPELCAAFPDNIELHPASLCSP